MNIFWNIVATVALLGLMLGLFTETNVTKQTVVIYWSMFALIVWRIWC